MWLTWGQKEWKKKKTWIDLRLYRRLFILCKFDLGRVDCTCFSFIIYTHVLICRTVTWNIMDSYIVMRICETVLCTIERYSEVHEFCWWDNKNRPICDSQWDYAWSYFWNWVEWWAMDCNIPFRTVPTSMASSTVHYGSHFTSIPEPHCNTCKKS